MDSPRLPRDCVINEESGFWTLRWRGKSFSQHQIESNATLKLVRIGAASGPEALSESDARRMAREYLLLPSRTRARQSEVTVADFVRTRFLPEFVTTKTIARRAHYRSILKLVLSPEPAGRMPAVYADSPNTESSGRGDWPCLSNMRLRDMRPDHVQRLIVAALAKGYSAQTVRRIRSVLSTVFSYAKQELVFLGANPATLATVPEPVRRPALALTLTDIERIVREMRYPEREITMIALFTDMNLSEICGLRWKSVNLTGTWSHSHGLSIPPITIAVDKRWYRGELTEAKGSRRRNLEIPEALLPILVLLSGRSKFSTPDDFVISSRTGTPINVTNITARKLPSIALRLGIPNLTWQRMRRAQVELKKACGLQFHFRIAAAAAQSREKLPP